MPELAVLAFVAGVVVALGMSAWLAVSLVPVVGADWAWGVGIGVAALVGVGVILILALVGLGWPALAYIGGLLALVTFLSLVTFAQVWLERKYLGRLQQRLGPTRVGPFGLLQPVADAVKLLLKEDILPSWADKVVYWTAPLIAFVPAFMVWVTIPFSPTLVLRNLDLGLLYVIAFSVLGITGLLVAGWGSANKYGVLGSLRSAAQLISYEIPIVVVALTVAMLAGSLNLVEIVERQSPIYALVQPLGLVLFLLAGLAEVGRTPFDIYHAESEIVGGPFVEYSGAHWAAFYLAEYVNTFLVGAMTTLLFLGGWKGPVLPPVVWFLLKTFAVVLVMFWFRGTFPRLRIDQLMALGWQVLVPLSFLTMVLTGAALYWGWPWWVLSLVSLAMMGGVGWAWHWQVHRHRPSIRLVPAREVRRAI
ncbi:MAG: NADH-quinone oxidoreductase subunit NuoH [Dehalococcoidia bacterium]|nr:NADH-quinone oxidoreductase subunit NuoH [Dehalococcoidia bacterium]MDW8119095.1 NADH-quinone oxidoreductase subunit NuoH [Chloroflexota bacterium]